MKTIQYYIAIAIITLITLSNSSKSYAQFVKAELQVSGLTCSMCQLATEKALKTLDFISDIKPDLNKNIYLLTFKKDKPVDLDQIKRKVKDAGFSVSELVAVFNFNQLAISSDFHYKHAGKTYHFINVSAKTLHGQTRLKILDKGFVPNSAVKKYETLTKMACYKTGYMGSERIFHVTI